MKFTPGTFSTFNLQFNFGPLLPPGDHASEKAKAAIVCFLVKRYGLDYVISGDQFHRDSTSFIIPERYNGSAKITFYQSMGVAVEADSKVLATEILDGIVDVVMKEHGK